MELENIRSNTITSSDTNKEGDDDFPLPGFRFHPTDEELVGFYLRRKVEKRPISLELIKQADIYKYDPWDLPKSSTAGDKEWYFYCKRGRKYKNSIRPNRVTSSGFWKATGIDKPIYDSSCIIGLKKSLVYYRGSAGKGTKTDWMMHEFRLPAEINNTKHIDAKTIAQEAEVWTLCRILKRNVTYRKIMNPAVLEVKSNTYSIDSSDHQSSYISFNAQNITNHHFLGHFSSSSVISRAPSVASSSFSSSLCNDDINEFLRHADWEDLRSITDCNVATAVTNPFYL